MFWQVRVLLLAWDKTIWVHLTCMTRYSERQQWIQSSIRPLWYSFFWIVFQTTVTWTPTRGNKSCSLTRSACFIEWHVWWRMTVYFWVWVWTLEIWIWILGFTWNTYKCLWGESTLWISKEFFSKGWNWGRTDGQRQRSDGNRQIEISYF